MFNEKILASTKSYDHNGLYGDYDVAFIDAAKLLPVMKKRMEHGLKAANDGQQRESYEDKNHNIANGVLDAGILPIWQIVIALSGDLAVDEDGNFQLPETNEECEKYYKCVQVVDGHNRVLSTEEIVKALHTGVMVTVQILNNPEPALVGHHFNVMNTGRKEVDKDLCFTIQYNLGVIKGHKREAYEHFVHANSDYEHPLHNRIKIDDQKGGFGIKTMVDYMVNNSIDVIEVLSQRYKTQSQRYEAMKRYWQVVERENTRDCAGEKVVDENGKTKRMTAQRAAVTNAELANFCQILFNDNNAALSAKNLSELYRMWVHDVMGAKHILLSDNGTIHYRSKEGNRVAKITDRWNGRHRAMTAIQTDFEMLTMAYNHQLVAERV